jgi:hypothetical protein
MIAVTKTQEPVNWISLAATGSCDSSVGIATGCGLGNRKVGVRVPVGSRIFSLQRPDWLLANPASYTMCTGGKAAGL